MSVFTGSVHNNAVFLFLVKHNSFLLRPKLFLIINFKALLPID